MENFQRTLIVCWFGVFVSTLGLSQIAPILPLYIKELGYENEADIAFYSGLAFGVTPLIMAFISPIWAVIAAKFGYKKMLIRASLGIALCTLALSFASSAQEIIIIRVITGFVSGFNPAAVVFIAIIAPKQNTAAALGTLSTASISGGLLGPLFGGVVAQIFSISVVFELVSFLLFCSFLMILFFIKEQVSDIQKTKEAPTKSRLFITIIFIITFFIQCATFGLAPIVTILVSEIYSGEYLALFAGIVVGASGVSNLLFTRKISRLADITSPSKVIFISLFMCGTMYCLQASASNVYVLIFWRLCLGVFLGGLMPCINALLKKIIHEKNLGFVLGLNQSAQFLGNFTGAFMGGIISGFLGAALAFLSIGLILILNSFVFLFFAKKYELTKSQRS